MILKKKQRTASKSDWIISLLALTYTTVMCSATPGWWSVYWIVRQVDLAQSPRSIRHSSIRSRFWYQARAYRPVNIIRLISGLFTSTVSTHNTYGQYDCVCVCVCWSSSTVSNARNKIHFKHQRHNVDYINIIYRRRNLFVRFLRPKQLHNIYMGYL